MKKILLSILVMVSVVYAEPTGIEQQITEIDVQIKRLQDQRKMLSAQLIANGAEEVLEKKEEKEYEIVSKEEVKSEKIDLLGFTTHTELGYIKTTGNTDTETYNIDINLKQEWEKHVLSINFLKLYGEEDGTDTKDKLFTEMNYYYKFTDRFAFDYMAAYKKDKFSGYDYQFYTGPGIVYKVLDEKEQTLLVKGNVLYARDQVEDTYLNGTGIQVDYPFPSGSINQHDGYSDEYAAYKAQALYTWLFSEKTKFTQDLRYRSQFDKAENYFVYSKSAFVAKLSDIFSASVSYQIDYINNAADGKENTDKTTMFNLIVDY